MELFTFYAFAAITLGGGLAAITKRNPMHCALGLMASLLGVAGIFLTLGAEFLFAVQILLYVGGVMVLFLFVIMLVKLDRDAIGSQFQRQWPFALLASGGLGTVLLGLWQTAIRTFPLGAKALDPKSVRIGNTEAIADTLFQQFVLPFEAASVLLFAAIIAAVLLSKKREGRPEKTS
jgi:NADH-quinone oxidoreductase subunit J